VRGVLLFCKQDGREYVINRPRSAGERSAGSAAGVKALAAATRARATDTSTDRCILWFPDNNFLLVYNEKKRGKQKEKKKAAKKEIGAHCIHMDP